MPAKIRSHRVAPDIAHPIARSALQTTITRLWKKAGVRSVGDGRPFKSCVAATTYIMENPHGIEASDLVRRRGPIHPLAHSGRFETASEVMVRHYSGEVMTIRPFFSLGPTRITPEHPVLCRELRYRWPNSKRGPLGLGPPEWVPAGELKEKIHAVAYPRLKGVSDEKEIDLAAFYPDVVEREGKIAPSYGQRVWVPKSVPIDESLMRLFGYYLSEGSTDRGHAVIFSFEDKEIALIDDVRSIVKTSFGLNATLHAVKNAVNVTINSSPVARMVEGLFSRGAAAKRIPSQFLSLPDALLWELLKGCLRGDGNVYQSKWKSTTVRVMATVSRHLAEQIRLILHRLGVPCSLYVYNAPAYKGGRIQAKRRIYYVDVGKTFSYLVRNGLGLDFEIKPPTEHRTEMKHQAWVDEDFVWVKINSVRRERYSGKVYNFEVVPSNSYTADGFVVHNCHGFRKFFKTSFPASACPLHGQNDVEVLMGHFLSYHKPAPEHLEEVYRRALPALLIDEKHRLKTEMKQKEEESSEQWQGTRLELLEQKDRIHELTRRLDELFPLVEELSKRALSQDPAVVKSPAALGQRESTGAGQESRGGDDDAGDS